MIQIAALAAIALVVAGGTWIVLDRTGTDDSPSWLFSHTANGGTLTANGDGTHSLTLTAIDPNVMAFTDRPDRQAAILTPQDLVDAWPSVFADSAPNAVLVEHAPTGDTDSLVVVLSDPRLDGSTMTYTAEILTDENHPSSVKGMVGAPHAVPPATFADASLFIDDVSPPSWVEPAGPNQWVCKGQFGWGAVLSSPAPIPAPASDAAKSQFDNACDNQNGVPRLYPA